MNAPFLLVHLKVSRAPGPPVCRWSIIKASLSSAPVDDKKKKKAAAQSTAPALQQVGRMCAGMAP